MKISDDDDDTIDGYVDDDDGDDLSLVLEHLKLLIVCLDFGLQGGHYSLSHPQLHLSESLACLKICQV